MKKPTDERSDPMLEFVKHDLERAAERQSSIRPRPCERRRLTTPRRPKPRPATKIGRVTTTDWRPPRPVDIDDEEEEEDAVSEERPDPRDAPATLPRTATRTIEWTRDFVQPLALAMAEGVARAQRVPDAPDPGRPILRTPTWPADESAARQALLENPRVSYTTSHATGCGPRAVPRRERRAFVPTAQGNGTRYNWKVSQAQSWDDLFQQVSKEITQGGYRISHIANTGPGFGIATNHPILGDAPAPPPPPHELPAGFDIVWTCDDDSDFVWGVDRVPAPTIGNYAKDQLQAKNRRPICLVNTGNQTIEGEFCVVWIQDRKYIGDWRWQIITAEWDQLQVRLQLEAALGYRPITATSWAGRTTMIMVSDGYEALPHVVRVYASAPDLPGFDPIAMFHAEVPHMPMCVECKSYPYFVTSESVPLQNAYVAQLWTIVGIFSQDIADNVATYGQEHAWSWRYSPQPPNGNSVEFLKQHLNRIHAFITFWNLAEDYGFEGPGGWRAALRVECRYFPPKFRAKSCGSLANPDPNAWETECDDPPAAESPGPFLPGAPFVCYLDALVWDYMTTYRVSAMTVAVQDKGNTWRLRRAYTYAPWEFEDTYPDSQFRIGSISKDITKFGFEVANEMGLTGALGLQSPIFTILPANYWPLVGGDRAYPQTVLLVQINHLIGHTSGWVQENFDPNWNHDTILASYSDAYEAGDATPAGWLSASGNALRPMVRDDSQRYMLREEIFQYNPLFTKGPNSQTLDAVTGWDPGVGPATPYVPGTDVRYSGYGYDLLGLVLEYLIPAGPSDPRAGYKNYTAWIKQHLLKPLNMHGTARGRTARARAKAAEVCYPDNALPPVELTGNYVLHSMPFVATHLYSPPSSDWYQDDDYPPDLFVAPQFSTFTHGGASRIEPFTPGGAWVSTAPDLCRLYRTVLLGEGSPLSDATINGITAGFTEFQFSGAFGSHLCWYYVDLTTARRIAACSNKYVVDSPFFEALKSLIKWAGV